MTKELPKRKHPRLSGYDYSREGYYFITACTKEKRCVFGRVVGRGILDAPQVILTDKGRIVEEAIAYLNENLGSTNIEKWVIMPNHIHLLIVVNNKDGASGKPRPTNAIIPRLISSLKRFSNQKAGGQLWQTSYYDHVIRNEEDYQRIWNYIECNPAKWVDDEYYLVSEKDGG